MSRTIPNIRNLGLVIAMACTGTAGALDAPISKIPPASEASIEYLAEKRIALGEADTSELRTRLRDELTIQQLLAQQATAKALEKSAEVRAQIELNQLAVLSKAYLKDYFDSHPITDQALEADYEKRRTAGEILEYRVRHLSVPDKDQAQKLLEQLEAGADLEQLAREHSTDPAADTGGGDIGWFRPDIFVDQNFADAVSALKKGETVSAPVKTRFGWHVIRVEDGPRPVKDLEPYAKVRPEIKKIIREKAMKQALATHIAELQRAAGMTAQGAGAVRLSQLP